MQLKPKHFTLYFKFKNLKSVIKSKYLFHTFTSQTYINIQRIPLHESIKNYYNLVVNSRKRCSIIKFHSFFLESTIFYTHQFLFL